MCGATAEERELQHNEASFSSMLQSNYATRYAQQSDILNGLNARLNGIVAKGASQQGFSPEELAARNSSAINTTGANYKHAAQALGGQLAGRGGDSGLVSGVDKQIKASLASAGAESLSNQENAITAENYATGRDQYNKAVAGQAALANQYDPEGYASQGTSANASSFGEADKIQQAEAQKWKTIAGGITGLASSFIPTGGLKALSGTFGKSG